MPSWNIKDSVTNLLPEGIYQMRFDSSTHGMTKGNEKNAPMPKITWKWIAIGGEYDGKVTFQNFTLRADLLGIIGSALAGTQAFDENEELPDDAADLSRICDSKLAGKVFEIDYKHNQPKGTTRVFSDLTIVGPTTGNFS